jgi:lysozyme family protein
MGDQIKSIDDLMINAILKREGSTFTDDPADRGGATKYGITQRAWTEALRTQHVIDRGVLDVRDLTEQLAREFYRAMYVQPLAWIDDLELRELVIDCAVNHGAERAVKWMQRAAGCMAVDGVIGPETRKLVNTFPARTLRALILIARFKFYAQIATDQMPMDPDAKFLRGWINRACEFIL